MDSKMVLLIDKTLLINLVGYLDLHISRIQTECANNPDESCIIDCLTEMQKLINTILNEQGITKTASKYTDQELTQMRLKV